jgi:hypothetical protein
MFCSYCDIYIEIIDYSPNPAFRADGALLRCGFLRTLQAVSDHARPLKRIVTIRLDEITINYFKKLADEIDVPYQTLINLYLRDCAATNRKLSLKWRPAG